MKKLTRFLSYVLVALLSSVLTLSLIPETPAQTATESKLDQLSSLIQERFVGEVDVTAMEDAAAAAMVNALGDRWSYYLSATEYTHHKEQMNNSYVGIGITILVREDGSGYDIRSVTRDGPAAQAGILPGDILIGAAGQRFQNVSDTQPSEIIRGEAGTTVEIVVLRDGSELTFNVERQVIKTPAAEGEMLPGNVGLVTITNFHSGCADETIAAVDELIAQGAQALIFDVRNNPGGYVSELVDALNHLLPEGLLFRSVDYQGRETREESDADFVDLPMAVLVNSESYSAAEFFAAAIREYDAGFVVGTQTCGKGYFQTTIQLKDNSAVGLSVGKYYTPKGVSLAEAGGIVPDLVVEVDEETFNAIYGDLLEPMEDPQIRAAWENLLGVDPVGDTCGRYGKLRLDGAGII